MKLMTNPNLRSLKNREQIPNKAVCYDVNKGWCRPGKTLVGHRFQRHSLNHPSITLVER